MMMMPFICYYRNKNDVQSMNAEFTRYHLQR